VRCGMVTRDYGPSAQRCSRAWPWIVRAHEENWLAGWLAKTRPHAHAPPSHTSHAQRLAVDDTPAASTTRFPRALDTPAVTRGARYAVWRRALRAAARSASHASLSARRRAVAPRRAHAPRARAELRSGGGADEAGAPLTLADLGELGAAVMAHEEGDDESRAVVRQLCASLAPDVRAAPPGCSPHCGARRALTRSAPPPRCRRGAACSAWLTGCTAHTLRCSAPARLRSRAASTRSGP
jgi:hypothetical protein